MSSTSSSECMCPECFVDYGVNDGSFRSRKPLYQALRQPLIYYTLKKQQNQRCKVSKKGSPNCFVKAFRWYTEERLPLRLEAHTRREFTEFASWLDVKYDEFLQQKQNGDRWRNVMKNPRDTDRITCEPYATNLFAKVKSPWRKKHSNKERSCTIEKRLQSLEFILEPKELSRPASEYYQQTPPNKPSKVSVASSELQMYKKTVIKTHHSETNAGTCGISNCVGEGVNTNESQKETLPKLDQQKLQTLNKVKNSRKQAPLSLVKEISCQCPEDKTVAVNTPTQYQKQDADWSTCTHNTDCILCTQMGDHIMPPQELLRISDSFQQYRIPKKCASTDKDQTDVSCQCSLKQVSNIHTSAQCEQKYSKTKCNCSLGGQAYLRRDAQEELATLLERNIIHQNEAICIQIPPKKSNNETSPIIGDAKKRFVKISTNDNSLQTSDNSIDLVRDGVQKYPHFLKIIYADKLKEERPGC
ncbi:hypothetical protein evm_010523 [Chilo suppressalis]|nr:hypothetical protein evm_010523 [Chilo suppressalis]